MSLEQTTQGFGGYGQQQPQNGEPKKSTNYSLGRVQCDDGRIELRMWRSKNNVLYTSIVIKQAIGKDPQGRTTFENSPLKDLPSVNFRVDKGRAFVNACRKIGLENLSFECVPTEWQSDAKIAVKGSPDGSVKLSITDSKGTRTMTVNATPMGNVNVNGNWDNFLALVETGTDRALIDRASDELFPQQEAPF